MSLGSGERRANFMALNSPQASAYGCEERGLSRSSERRQEDREQQGQRVRRPQTESQREAGRGWLCAQPSTGREAEMCKSEIPGEDRHTTIDDIKRIQAEERIQTCAEAARCTSRHLMGESGADSNNELCPLTAKPHGRECGFFPLT